MIDQKELRIGNLVQYNPKGVDKGVEIIPLSVELIFCRDMLAPFVMLNDGFENRYSVDEIDPIPITPEWLERFGFYHYTTPATIIGSMTGEDGSKEGWFLNTVHLRKFGNDFQTVQGVFITIKSIHQLQNLYFALTGEELKIKDNAKLGKL